MTSKKIINKNRSNFKPLNLKKNFYKLMLKKKLIEHNNFMFFDLFLKKIFSVLIYTGKKIKVVQIFLNWIKILKFLFFKKLKKLKQKNLSLILKKRKRLFHKILSENKNSNFKKKNKVKSLYVSIKKIFKSSKIKHKKFKNKKFIKKLRIKNKKFIKKLRIKNKKFIKKLKLKNKKFKIKKKLSYFSFYKLIFINRLHKIICPKIGYQSFFRKGVLNKKPNVTKFTLKDRDRAYTLVSFWLKKATNSRKEKTFILRFYSELIDINLKKGSTFKQKIEYYKVLYKNKKFYKFKKWI